MDWENFGQYVIIATAAVVATGVVGAAVTELIRQLWALIARRQLSSEVKGVMSGLFSCGLAAWGMSRAGVPLEIAVLACIVALYTPKIVHDKVRNA